MYRIITKLSPYPHYSYPPFSNNNPLSTLTCYKSLVLKLNTYFILSSSSSSDKSIPYPNFPKFIFKSLKHDQMLFYGHHLKTRAMAPLNTILDCLLPNRGQPL